MSIWCRRVVRKCSARFVSQVARTNGSTWVTQPPTVWFCKTASVVTAVARGTQREFQLQFPGDWRQSFESANFCLVLLLGVTASSILWAQSFSVSSTQMIPRSFTLHWLRATSGAVGMQRRQVGGQTLIKRSLAYHNHYLYSWCLNYITHY